MFKKHNRLLTIILFFSILAILIFVLFRKAFSIDFISDDFAFLKLGKVSSLSQFLYLFYPFQNTFYRPIPAQFFYFLINSFKLNLFLIHSIVFIIYFIGLFYLYKSILFISKNKIFSRLTIFLYAISFAHVFQLYWVTQFQEIAVFTFLTITFYCFLIKKFKTSIFFFILSLLSKEIASLFPLFLFLLLLFRKDFFPKKRLRLLIFYAIPAVLYLIIDKYSIGQMNNIDIYKINLNPKLIINNITWYTLWSLGLANFFPVYIKSILFKPLPDFWKLFLSEEFRRYFYILITYYSVLIPSIIALFIYKPKKIINIIKLVAILFLAYLLFISPTLPIIHRWMVRLTIPLIFIIAIQAYLFYEFYRSNKILRFVMFILIVLFIGWNYYGVQVHESSSIVLLDSNITKNSRKLFTDKKDNIISKKYLYFIDTYQRSWTPSKKIKNVLNGENFKYYFFPESNIKVLYDFDHPEIPKNSYVIESEEIVVTALKQ